MARRTFDVVDIIEILVHWHAGRNNTEIAGNLNVDRKTVRKYVVAAEAAGMVPGWPPLSEVEWDAKVREWFPGLADTRLRQVTWPAIEPHHGYIREPRAAKSRGHGHDGETGPQDPAGCPGDRRVSEAGVHPEVGRIVFQPHPESAWAVGVAAAAHDHPAQGNVAAAHRH